MFIEHSFFLNTFIIIATIFKIVLIVSCDNLIFITL